MNQIFTFASLRFLARFSASGCTVRHDNEIGFYDKFVPKIKIFETQESLSAKKPNEKVRMRRNAIVLYV